jgi:hypothetical protein
MSQTVSGNAASAAARNSTAVSVSSCVMMRPRLAPTASRVAISRRRTVARASSMPATLAQAMASSAPVSAKRMPMKARNGVRSGPGIRLSGAIATPCSWFARRLGRFVGRHQRVQLGIGLLAARTRREPPDGDVPDRAGLLEQVGGGGAAHGRDHRRRDPHVGADQRRAGEPGLGHANDGEFLVVEPDWSVKDAWIAGEPRHPEAVRQDDDRLLAGSAILLLGEKASERRARPEHLEIIGGHQAAEHALARPLDRQAHRARAEVHGRHPRERGGVLPQVAERRVGHVVESTPTGRPADVHDAAGILDAGPWGEHQRIGQAEDRAAGRDPERQREDGRGGENRAAAQEAKGVPGVGKDGHALTRRVRRPECSPYESGTVPFACQHVRRAPVEPPRTTERTGGRSARPARAGTLRGRARGVRRRAARSSTAAAMSSCRR